MNVPPGFALLERLIAEHKVDRDGASALVPCLHEELGKDIHLLRAGVRRCGGVLYDLNDDALWENPPGPISRDRSNLLEGIMQGAGGDVPGSLVFSQHHDGGVEARFSDKKTVAEPSLQVMLRCAAVVASAAYDEHELVIITVDSASLDARRKELLWSMLTIAPDDLTVQGKPVTVVPIFGASVDPQVDYPRRPAVRFVVRWDRVVRRSEARRKAAVRSIATSEGPIVIFLGAGASATAGIPLGNVYRDRALTELVGPKESSRAAAEAFFDHLHEHEHFMPGEERDRAAFVEQLTLERVLLETFKELGYRDRTSSPLIQDVVRDCEIALQYLRPGRRAIRELAARLPGRLVIITVNFDQLVETDLGVDSQVSYRPDQFKANLPDLLDYVQGDTTKAIPVLKLHGSIQDVNSLIATIDKTSAGLHEDVAKALDEVLRVCGTPITWVWVGCSMRDRDINKWLGGRGPKPFDEWWVDPLPGPSLDEFIQQQRAPGWALIDRTLDDRLIVDSADGFLAALAEQVAKQAGG